MAMRLFYYRAPHGNFGDDLNDWLWEELLPGHWTPDSPTLFSGIGTIIGHPLPPAEKVVIFSSGIGYGPVPENINGARWHVAGVRGPLTARLLRMGDDIVVGDGALLLAKLISPAVEQSRRGVVFVPHVSEATDAAWLTAAQMAGIELVDPRLPCDQVIERLRTARLVIADSMHAAIVADTLRVPWIPVVSSERISTFKWLDWTLSMQLPYEPVQLRSGRRHRVTQNEAIAQYFEELAFRKQGKARLSRVMARAVRPLRWLQVEKTADVLASLKRRSGFLSDSQTLNDRVDELGWRLERVAALH